jgi:transposase
VESTGGYENNWLNALSNFSSQFNIKVARLNPFGVNANSKAGLSRITTDPISARNIAEYLIAHPEKVQPFTLDRFARYRKLWTFIRMLIKQKGQLLNQLESMLYLANPEILSYCKHHTPKWVLKLLEKYPTAHKIKKAHLNSFTKIPYISMDKAQQIKLLAKNSVASAKDDTSALIISATVAQILHLQELINQHIKTIKEENQMPEIKLLKSFNGIDDVSALGLLMEIQDINRYPDVKHLASFFGLHPVFKESGDGKSGFRMSKKGRRAPRHILYMVAMTAIRTNPLIREIYQRKVDEGMTKMAALGLCMHKILRIVYGMLKHNKAFDENVDRNNQSRKSKRQIKKFSKRRRYQNFDNKAPISARQSKKRKSEMIGIDTKEQAASQNGLAIECGFAAPVPSSLS